MSNLVKKNPVHYLEHLGYQNRAKKMKETEFLKRNGHIIQREENFHLFFNGANDHRVKNSRIVQEQSKSPSNRKKWQSKQRTFYRKPWDNPSTPLMFKEAIEENGREEEGGEEGKGWIQEGCFREGMVKEGYLKEGYNQEGFIQEGVVKDGFSQEGIKKDSRSKGSREDMQKELGFNTRNTFKVAGTALVRPESKKDYYRIAQRIEKLNNDKQEHILKILEQLEIDNSNFLKDS